MESPASDQFGVRKADLLSGVRLFSGLSSDLVQTLAGLCTFHEYPAGRRIFSQGDPGDDMYIVIKGRVRIFVTSADGDEMVLVELRPFESFGELALLDGQPRSASVETLEPTVCMSLTRAALLGLMRTDPEMTEALLRTLGGTVRRLTEQTSDLVFLDLHERVIKLLSGLVNQQGTEEPEGIVLPLVTTLNDLSTVVGGSRDSVAEVLRSFEQFGYLEIGEDRILVRDVTRLHQAIHDRLSWTVLAQQALQDPLTQLANRVHFDQRIAHALRQARARSRSVAVLIIDLDDFKSVNDSLGHKAGDHLLAVTADRLRGCIRQPDSAARLGGDEFGLLLSEIDAPASAEKVAARVVAALEEAASLPEGSVRTSASVGLAVAGPDDDATAATLIEHADQAMYEAKRSGKHGYAVYAASAPRARRTAGRR